MRLKIYPGGLELGRASARGGGGGRAQPHRAARSNRSSAWARRDHVAGAPALRLSRSTPSWHYGRVNRAHNLVCSSGWWSRAIDRELLPWVLDGVQLGEDVLEFGPGFGATTQVLARQCSGLHVLELDEGYCQRLRSKLGQKAVVTHGDATRMPFEDHRFSAVVCFTMLHHIPSSELQDRALAEAARVLRPGGVFAGSDSIGGGALFRAIHIGDTLNLVDPGTFETRLRAAGFVQPRIDTTKRSFRWRALVPG